MADRIVLQKLGFAFAPAQKVTSLKHEKRDPDKRRFERRPMEQGEENQEDTIDLDANVQDNARKDGQVEDGSFEDEGKQCGSDNGGPVDGPAPLGSVVDIHV